METATIFQDIATALRTAPRRERRRRLIALVGGQAQIARRAGVAPSTVCRIIAGWDGGIAAARAEGVIRHSLRRISRDLEQLWAA